MEQRVEHQKVVTFIYSILDQDGSMLEQSDLPLSYLHGVDGRMYERVEQALTGKKIGDEVRADVPPEEGFGPYDPELTYSDALENVPEEFRQIGAEAEFEDPEGERITMVVTRIEDGRITLDGNHPFAGKTVTFVIRITDIRDASQEEIDRGGVEDSEKPQHLH
ncbi:MAG: FKBP-type peptidyl-prolyl cis-trans isomerase [Gammaproteobacteria bacterium]